MIVGCGSQLRVGGFGVPFALDFGAVMAVGTARRVDLDLLAASLPAAEAAILSGRDDCATDDEEEG
ncbi:DUF7697 family protein [Sphingomonas nostoxanthinifaciens]|uniref:DUF7697 family protein n=1 Tax=Sphingomonas nostoxanthinifaciens TaxID=2872652 RepID=UPI001CC1F952|nr:hypothetical protein [Sphingomonas nostoxanthinifaciens]UAK24182.1 hypothetical protein K8P63_17925 [Sphingomonas nostoxanthinifaciens]